MGRFQRCLLCPGGNCNYDNMELTGGFSCRRETALGTGLFPTGFPVPIGTGEDGFFGWGLCGIVAKKSIDLSIQVDQIVPATFHELGGVFRFRR